MNHKEFRWLSHDGEMARLIREFDWNSTPLGPVTTWPKILKDLINLILNSGIPMALCWGEELTHIYNDAIVPMLALRNRHPTAFGISIIDAWPEAREELIVKFQRVMAGHEVGSNDLRLMLKRDGVEEEAIFNYSYAPIFHEGKVAGTFITCIETTSTMRSKNEVEYLAHELKLANDDLEIERDNFQKLFSESPEMVCMLSGPDHIFDFVSSAYIKTLGFDSTGMSIKEAQPESVEIHEILDDVFKTGKSAYLTEAPVTIGDKIRYFNVIYVARKDREGHSVGIISLGYEVTDQILARAEIMKANLDAQTNLKKLDTIVEHLTEGLIFADIKGNIIYMNPEALRIHEFKSLEDVKPRAEAYPYHFELYNLSGRKVPLHDWPISRVIRGENFVDYELEVRQLDNKRRWIGSYNGIRVFDGQGNVLMHVLSVRDITAKKEIEFDLKEALKSRDEFLSIASHELRTPLTSLKIQLQMTERGIRQQGQDYPPEKLMKVIDVSLKQVNRLTTLVDDLLDVSRIKLGKLTNRFEMTALKPLIQELVERFSEQCQATSTPIEFQSAVNPSIYCDPFRIDQVITNLINNSLKYAAGGPIKVYLFEDPKGVTIKVQDFGTGIPQEKLPYIFNRFERAVLDTNITGLGLGLYITKSIVEGHGGEITVESKLGEGTTFRVFLPWKRSNQVE